jgi:hypothetical protein
VANYPRDFGVAATVTGDVKESLERSALSFADWGADHAVSVLVRHPEQFAEHDRLQRT